MDDRHPPRVLSLILAGGEGNRLGPLTAERAKPVVPFAGTYRLIDFPLSNCAHSGLSDVWIVQQYEPLSLEDHLANGRPWDLDRNTGGLRTLHPHSNDDSTSGMMQGNGDALARNARSIREFQPDVVLVLSADHVYALDYRTVLERHRDSGADLTMVTAEVPKDDAARYGVVSAEGDRVRSYTYKPDEPETSIVSTEVFAFDPDTLLQALEEASKEGAGDLGERALPTIVEGSEARCMSIDGYWRDVGTVSSYRSAHMEIVDGLVDLDPGDPSWPIRGRNWPFAPARVEGGRVSHSMLSPGVVVHGSVTRSVIGPGTMIEERADVSDSVILDRVTVRRGASVRRAILDSRVEIGTGASVGGGSEDRADEDLTVIGQRVAISADSEVLAGTELDPS